MTFLVFAPEARHDQKQTDETNATRTPDSWQPSRHFAILQENNMGLQMTAREALTQAIAFLANETRTLETSRTLIDLLRADLPPDPPTLSARWPEPDPTVPPLTSEEAAELDRILAYLHLPQFTEREREIATVSARAALKIRHPAGQGRSPADPPPDATPDAAPPCPWTVEEIVGAANALDGETETELGDTVAMLRYLAARVKEESK